MLFLFLSSDLWLATTMAVSEEDRRNLSLSLTLPGRRLLPSLELEDSLLKVVFTSCTVLSSELCLSLLLELVGNLRSGRRLWDIFPVQLNICQVFPDSRLTGWLVIVSSLH